MPKYQDSITRRTNEKLGEAPSVLDWIPASKHSDIVAGTSSYDAAADIQKAIEATKPGNGGHGLLIPSGKYMIGSPLKVYTGSMLYGGGVWLHGGVTPWSGASLWQAPGANCDLIISGHDPNFGGDDNWCHGTILRNLFLYGDRTNNNRGSGINLYRVGENAVIDCIAAYGFPRNGIRVYDYAAPARIGMVSVHNNGSWIVCTADASTDMLTAASHGLQSGERVKIKSIGGSVPAGLTAWREYWVVGATTNTFQVSLTKGGGPVDLTSAGSGTILALAGCGVSFESALNSHNSMELISGDNNAKALVEVFTAYRNSVYIGGIKSERANVGLTPYPGNDVVLSCVNLNGGCVVVGSMNVYAAEAGGRAIIHNDCDGANTYGTVHVLGATTLNPYGNETNYTYAYENRYEATGITVAEWIGRPQHPEMDFYFADRVLRALRMRSDYSAIMLEGPALANPNPIALNAVNFGDPSQGGFFSVNSRYAGFPNWQKVSSHDSNDAMFVRLAAQMFEVMFGSANNTGGPDPGTSALKVDANRTTMKGEARVDLRGKTGYPFIAYIDSETRSLIVQEAEQPFGWEWYKNVSGGSYNIVWQALIDAASTALRFKAGGVTKAELTDSGIFSVTNGYMLNGRYILCGATGPEGVYDATPGSIFLKTDGTFWLKATNTDSSGWVQAVGGDITGKTLTVDDPAAYIQLKKSGVLKFRVDADGKITEIGVFEKPVSVKSDSGYLEVQTSGGVTKFKADAGGNVQVEGDLALNARTASRILRTDASKKVTTGPVDLSSLNDVTAGSMTSGQVAQWNGSYLIGVNIGAGASDVAAGNHNHAGVYAAASVTTGGSATLAKLTAGGANGSISWNDDGQITGYVAPT